MSAACHSSPLRDVEDAQVRGERPRPVRGRFVVGSLLRDEAANAMVEIAVIFSFLGIPFILGTAEMATLVYYSMENSNAAHAGACYGMRSATFAEAASGIATAAQAEAPDIASTLTVTSSIFYTCSSAPAGTQYTGLTAQVLATLACTGGSNHPLEFVKVNTSTVVTPPFHSPGLPTSFTLTASSIMEVEQ
jgi:hypothetical protein